jgi:putative spermidine/putrescine transport system ATP-binding protein/spermidine/putrescine transport system ATP-binding protein
VDEKSISPAVQLKGVYKRFGKVEAVQKMDLDFEEGSLVTLLGPSGCGKTTILRMIAGLEAPTEGDIYIKGKRVNDIPIHKRNLGMIFQNYALFPHKTIFDNVAFGLKYREVAKSEMQTKVKKALEMVRLPGVEGRMPSQLSGGQQQRIAMARAIVIEPDVLLMDEPLSALDENLREEMRREIDNLQQMLGVTTIFVTHDQREALSMSDKIVVMNDGLLQQEGSPEEVYNYPRNHFVSDFLGHSNFFGGVVSGADGQAVGVRLPDGNELNVQHPGDWADEEPVELVIRAQKFELSYPDEAPPEPDMNTFDGTIKDRSYMGGEVSYFVELESGTTVHVIGIAKLTPFRKGEKIRLHVAPRHCGLLKKDKTA